MSKIADFSVWLNTECEQSEIRYLDDKNKTGAYIPIGIIEMLLDNFDVGWDTTDFKFNIYKTGHLWMASGSLVLQVQYFSDNFSTISRHSRVGACSMQISSKDDNVDYEGTILSFCLANAAKKLGKRFGRHLNGRLDKGETALPIIQVGADRDPYWDKNDQEYMEIQRRLAEIDNREDAQAYLETTSFKYTQECKKIVNSKPSKNL